MYPRTSSAPNQQISCSATMLNLRTLNTSESIRILPGKLRDLQFHVPSFQSWDLLRSPATCRLVRLASCASCTGVLRRVRVACTNPLSRRRAIVPVRFKVPRRHKDFHSAAPNLGYRRCFEPPLTWGTDARGGGQPTVTCGEPPLTWGTAAHSGADGRTPVFLSRPLPGKQTLRGWEEGGGVLFPTVNVSRP